jgi:hypothetical protein
MIRMTAMPCRTPKLMKLFGNISAEPSVTSTAQPAICSQRRQKRSSGCPWADAIAWPPPTHAMKSVTMHARCTVQNGSR